MVSTTGGMLDMQMDEPSVFLINFSKTSVHRRHTLLVFGVNKIHYHSNKNHCLTVLEAYCLPNLSFHFQTYPKDIHPPHPTSLGGIDWLYYRFIQKPLQPPTHKAEVVR